MLVGCLVPLLELGFLEAVPKLHLGIEHKFELAGSALLDALDGRPICTCLLVHQGLLTQEENVNFVHHMRSSIGVLT